VIQRRGYSEWVKLIEEFEKSGSSLEDFAAKLGAKAATPVDMRNSIDGLAAIVRNQWRRTSTAGTCLPSRAKRATGGAIPGV